MKLGAYKNLKVKAPDETIPEAELSRSISNMRKKNALFFHIDDRAAQIGDLVVINYDGSIHGQPFLGGKAHHHRMILGSGKFIPGFEEQIVGHFIGDVFDINVTFPTSYANPQLAGQNATFHTELVFMGYEEVPAFDDDFALNFSSFATAKELRDSLLTSLQAKKAAAEQERIQQDLLTQIITASEIPENEEILAELQEEYFEERLYDLELQGITLEDYLVRSHLTIEDIQHQCSQKARREYQQTAILHAIADAENFTVSDEDLMEAIYQLVDFHEDAAMEMWKNLEDEQRIGLELQLLCDQAMQFVLETAIYI